MCMHVCVCLYFDIPFYFPMIPLKTCWLASLSLQPSLQPQWLPQGLWHAPQMRQAVLLSKYWMTSGKRQEAGAAIVFIPTRLLQHCCLANLTIDKIHSHSAVIITLLSHVFLKLFSICLIYSPQVISPHMYVHLMCTFRNCQDKTLDCLELEWRMIVWGAGTTLWGARTKPGSCVEQQAL